MRRVFHLMESKDKIIIKKRFGKCIQKIIEENKVSSMKNADHASINSLRKLAAASGVEFSIIQKISSGQKNPALTTVVAIAEGFGISLSQLFSYYDAIEEDKSKKKKK